MGENKVFHIGDTVKTEQPLINTKSEQEEKSTKKTENSSSSSQTECNFQSQWLNFLKKTRQEKEIPLIQNKFYCTHCNYSSKLKNNVKVHTERKHVKKEKVQFRCTMCSYIAKREYFLVKHYRYKHKVDDCSECKQLRTERCKNHKFETVALKEEPGDFLATENQKYIQILEQNDSLTDTSAAPQADCDFLNGTDCTVCEQYGSLYCNEHNFNNLEDK